MDQNHKCGLAAGLKMDTWQWLLDNDWYMIKWVGIYCYELIIGNVEIWETYVGVGLIRNRHME